MMVDRVQYHLPDWISGTEELDFEQEAVYRKLCDFIYLLDGYLKDDDHHNSHRVKLSIRKYRSIKKSLIEFGKIEVVDGWIHNARSSKELHKIHAISDRARAKVNRRWNKSKKDQKNIKTPKRREKDAKNSPKNEAKPLKPLNQAYTNSLTRESIASPTDSCTVLGDGKIEFEAFWKAFPKGRKNGKKKAAEIFNRKVKNGDVTAEELVAGATRYHADVGDDFKFVLMPTTWLNQERWSDEQAAGPTSDQHGSDSPSGGNRRERIAGAYNRRVATGKAGTR